MVQMPLVEFSPLTCLSSKQLQDREGQVSQIIPLIHKLPEVRGLQDQRGLIRTHYEPLWFSVKRSRTQKQKSAPVGNAVI